VSACTLERAGLFLVLNLLLMSERAKQREGREEGREGGREGGKPGKEKCTSKFTRLI
jgi:hypothetical protein